MHGSTAKDTRIRNVAICLLLVAGTLFLYWPTRTYDFVGYDDPFYIVTNTYIHNGFSLEGLAWAFGRITSGFTYWHPLSWMSHMLDCQLFGLEPGAHHMMNAVYHAINAVLLFFVLRALTGATWRSALVAGLFAWHPLNVESVAWVTERKNLLSTFFLFLTIGAYAKYVDATRTRATNTKRFYGAALFLFACGLMSKPMLVTVPGLLLLLDFWPLNRVFGHQMEVNESGESADSSSRANVSMSRIVPLLVEKIPFLILSIISAVVTVVSHHKFESLAEGQVSFGVRIANAFYSYARYLKKMVWPDDLAAIYPFPTSWPASRLIICVLLFLAVSALAIWWRRKRPYLLFGWLWFLVALVPVIGVVQAGAQAMADRFAYIPLIGVFLAVVWAVAELPAKFFVPKVVYAALAGVVLLACLGASRHQLPFWRDSIALFERALLIEKENPIAHYNLAYAYGLQKKNTEAKKHYAEAIRISRHYIDAHNNLAALLLSEGQEDEAIARYRDVLKSHPNHGLANFNLGIIVERQGKLEEALKYYHAAVTAQPQNIDFRLALANALGNSGRGPEAIQHIVTAVQLNPNSPEAHYNAGNAMMMTQNVPEALRYFGKALELRPAYPEAHYNFGTVLAMTGDVPKATPHFAQAVQLKPDFAEARMAYGMALLEAGKKEDGSVQFREALRLAKASGQTQLASQIEARLNESGSQEKLLSPEPPRAQQ